jgi:hypothetical protein
MDHARRTDLTKPVTRALLSVIEPERNLWRRYNIAPTAVKSGASIETTLELWVTSLRDVKRPMRRQVVGPVAHGPGMLDLPREIEGCL